MLETAQLWHMVVLEIPNLTPVPIATALMTIAFMPTAP
jgi:hypothetical protein